MSTPSKTLFGKHKFLARPYEGVEALTQALELSFLEISGEIYSPGNVSLSPESFPIDSGSIKILFDGISVVEALEKLGINSTEVSLACIAYGAVVASSQVMFNQVLSSIESPVVLDLNGDRSIFESPSGFDVRIILYLSEDLEPQGFRPHKWGTWLSIATFSIAPFSSMSRFSPIPLDESQRKYLGLPKECMSYVEVVEDLIEVDSLEDAISVFVDISILRLLQENPKEPLALYVQLDLVMSTLNAIVFAVARQLQGSGQYASYQDLVLSKKAVTKPVTEIARSAGVEPEALLDAALYDPGRVRSFVEAHVKAMRTSSRALREVS